MNWSEENLRHRSNSRNRKSTPTKKTRTKEKAKSRIKLKSRNNLQSPLQDIHNRYGLNRVDSLLSPGSPYTPAKQHSLRKREHMILDKVGSRFGALSPWDKDSLNLNPWDTHSLASGTEEDVGHDRYSSMEHSPVKTHRTATSSMNKGNSFYSPIANPLHRFPPRVMGSDRRKPEVQIRTTSMADRKEQVKRDIAATLAHMNEDELGNIIYKPRSAADILASKKSIKSQDVNNYNGNLNGNLKRVGWGEENKGNHYRGRPKPITVEGARSIDSADDERLIKKISKVSIKEKKQVVKSNTRLRSPIRKFRRHKSLMDRSVKSLSPNSTHSSNTAPTKYIFAFGSANTYDDEITFHTNESAISIGRECDELRALNDTICIGLKNGVKYVNGNHLKDSAIAHGEELISDMVKNAAQMEGQMVQEFHALGEKMDTDCERIRGCEEITRSPYDAIDSMMMQMAKQESYSFDARNEGESSDEQTDSEYNDEQSDETNDKKGETLKSLRNAIKTKLFRKGNNVAAQMGGQMVEEFHSLGENMGTEDCEGINECKKLPESPYNAVNSMMQMAKQQQSYLFGARNESEYVNSDEQTERTEQTAEATNVKQGGALKSLRNVIKTNKNKLFKKGNNVANSAGEGAFKMHRKYVSSAP